MTGTDIVNASAPNVAANPTPATPTTPAAPTTPNSAGDVNTPPAGGYANSGWYWDPSVGQARQYNAGTGFGAPTTINNPNEAGYGSVVNPQVVQAGLTLQGKTMAGYGVPQGGATSPQPGTPVSPSGTDLSTVYNNAYTQAGIPTLQTQAQSIQSQINQRTADMNKSLSDVHDNPFYSEANMSGIGAKIKADASNDISKLDANLKQVNDQITTAKSNVDTQLNLYTKQLDMNSAQSKQAFDEFNSLLGNGALTGASSSDLAAYSKATGVPISFLKSAVTNSTKANPTQLIQSTDDKGNVTVSVVDPKTGDVLKQTSLGAVGAAKTVPEGQTTVQNQQQYTQWALQNIKDGADLRSLVTNYVQPGGLSIDNLLRLYNTNSPNGVAKESLADITAGNFVNNPNAEKKKNIFGF